MKKVLVLGILFFVALSVGCSGDHTSAAASEFVSNFNRSGHNQFILVGRNQSDVVFANDEGLVLGAEELTDEYHNVLPSIMENKSYFRLVYNVEKEKKYRLKTIVSFDKFSNSFKPMAEYIDIAKIEN